METFKDFFSAWGFLTVLGGSKEIRSGARRWWWLVGVFLGSCVGAIYYFVGSYFGTLIGAALGLGVGALITGFLHFDGLIDCADGLIPPMERSKRLEVMKDPRAGAFGVIALVFVVLIQFAAVSTLPHCLLVILLFGGIFTVSRTLMSLIMTSFRNVSEASIANHFVGDKSGKDENNTVEIGRKGNGRFLPFEITGLIVGLVLLGIGNYLMMRHYGASTSLLALHMVFTFFMVLIGGLGVALLSKRKLGGYSGDVLGAIGVIGETFGLVASCLKW
ncbi:MAG: adenosylcobinamide-GDP ribazoletransferase [Acidimicrobiales bacterium]|nr:adenosylcobinamide-GDP ribazoletransferase [Acidimicrobiales bacterium]